MKKILESKITLVIVSVLLSTTINVVANNVITSGSVSYTNSKTSETTVNGALNELFSAVDINERLGNTDNISSIGDGTVASAISTTNSTVNTLYNNRSHVGMIIQSTTLDTMEKVKAIYGGTTWVKIEGRFLLGASSSYAVNSTGGSTSNSVTPTGTIGGTALTVAQLPSHTHTFTGTVATITGGSHYHYSFGNITDQVTTLSSSNYPVRSSSPFLDSSFNAMIAGSSTVATIGKTSTSSTHSHSYTPAGTNKNTGSGSTHTHTFTGTAQSVSTMSPYKAVYIWERTA